MRLVAISGTGYYDLEFPGVTQLKAPRYWRATSDSRLMPATAGIN